MKTSFLLVMLGMAGNLNAAEVAPHVDNRVAPCDENPATSSPPCFMDNDSIVVPPEMPGSDESVATPPAPVEEDVREELPPTSIPPPAPVPPKPKLPEEEPPGLIPPPQPKPKL